MRRPSSVRGLFVVVGALGLFHCLAAPAAAFYQRQWGASDVELRGFVDLSGAFSRNPADTVFYPDRTEALWGGSGRFLADARLGAAARTELNVLQTVRAKPSFRLASPGEAAVEVERSALLTWEQHESGNSEAQLDVDVLTVGWSCRRLDLTLGRQPVNLATTFYFSPNDFFAPFSAQTFFRVYKPGVDAARAEVRLGELSQLSIIGVLGYEPDPSRGNGWSASPDWSRASLLGRLAVPFAGFEWALLAGSVRDQTVSGGSLQGELFNWLGIRAEGHYAAAETGSAASGLEVTVGLEHRFVNSLTIRLEQFHHGQGYGSIDLVNEAARHGRLGLGYTGRDYTAFDMGYEFSPLLTGELLLIRNWTDQSWLFSVNSVYSLSDESELNLNITVPHGHAPDQATIRSEFGLEPCQAALAYRRYF